MYKNREEFLDSTYQDADGYYRWSSNDSIPPTECLVDAEIPSALIVAHEIVREREQAAVLEEYVKQEERFWSEPEYEDARRERMFEMKAAFGSGEVYNCLTGKTITI